MKVRSGFVSNSSSSSFIIATKPGVTVDDLVKSFGINEKSPFYFVAQEVAELILREDKMTPKEAVKYLKEDYGYDDVTEHDYWDIIEKAMKKGLEVRIGSASDEDGGTEAVFCDMDLHYEDDNIIIEKDGGY